MGTTQNSTAVTTITMRRAGQDLRYVEVESDRTVALQNAMHAWGIGRLDMWDADRETGADLAWKAAHAVNGDARTVVLVRFDGGDALSTPDYGMTIYSARPRSTVSRSQVTALRDEAAQHGDDAQVEICDRALEGDADALAECARVIGYAAAQEVR